MPLEYLQINSSQSALTYNSVIRLLVRTELNEFLLSQKCNLTVVLGKTRMKRLVRTFAPKRQVFWNACFDSQTGLILRVTQRVFSNARMVQDIQFGRRTLSELVFPC